MFFATKLLSRQTRVCRDKHNFVTTSILLSRQGTCFVFFATNVLSVVATKMALVAVPANDSRWARRAECNRLPETLEGL